jgi:GAF domain-containing protein
VEPIQETADAFEEFGPLLFEQGLLERIRKKGRRVQLLVPECTALSIALLEPEVTFTLVCSAEVSAPDGLGPVGEASREMIVNGVPPTEVTEHDVLDEETWQALGRGSAAAGVASTLTLPVLEDDRVIGSVNLYARTPSAFAGIHAELAEIFGAWPGGAVANADLGFTTRETAEDAPRVLFERARIEVAVSILISAQGVSEALARQHLNDAAQRAGVSQTAIARLIIGQATGRPAADDAGEGSSKDPTRTTSGRPSQQTSDPESGELD